MGEWNRRARCAVVAGCAGILAALVGCSDTSVAGPGPALDATPEGSSLDGSPVDSSHLVSADAADAHPTDSAANEATTDASPPEAATVSPDAGTVDATTSMDATSAEASAADAPATEASDAAAPPDVRVDEAAAPEAASIPPLLLCGVLDSDWGITNDAAACQTASPDVCTDRASNWANAIATNYAVALSADCRISQMASPPVLTGMQSTDYVVALTVFTLDFFGCPQPGNDAGPVTFGLVPEPLWSQVFTTADLQALSDLYVSAVAQSLSDQSAPVLTDAQTNSINAKLRALAGTVPGTVTSSAYTYDTCSTEAGAEASSDSSATTDGGADSGD